MSKTKGLEYQANEPAFLQRMRAQNSGGDGRHERPVPRPKRGKADDEDDAPTYVLEETNDTLTKEEYDKLAKDDPGVASGDEDGNVTGTVHADGPCMSGALPVKDKGSAPGEREERAPTGRLGEAKLGQKKRKAAAVIGQDKGDEHEAEAKPKKTKKKGRPIKLSFDEHED